MTAHWVTIGLLLAFPWTLVGVILLGTAARGARRWLDNRQCCPIRRRQTPPGRAMRMRGPGM